MLDKLRHHWNVSSRREFFTRAGSGLAGIALASMLAEDAVGGAATVDPLAPKKAHHPATAKSVIFLFMEGGPSHVDLFDPKPLLTKLDGQPIPASIGKPKQTAQGTANNSLMASKRTWKQYGQSGMWVSDWYAEYGRTCRRHDDHSLLLGGWIEPCWFGLPDEYRIDSRRAPLDGRVGDVWAGHGQQEPALVRRDDG